MYAAGQFRHLDLRRRINEVVAVTTVTGPYIIARYRCFAEMYPQHELTLLELGRESRDYAWTPSSVDVPYQRKILSDKPIEEYSSRNRPH